MLAVLLFCIGLVYSSFVGMRKFRSKSKKNKMETYNSAISYHQITREITLLRNKDKVTQLNKRQEDRLILLFCWMNAKRKEAYKYADIWLQKGFDVVTVHVNTWQILWPIIGSQVIATDVLNFLHQNKTYSKVIVYGFSAGGYMWSEVMVKMVKDINKYQYIFDKVVGQVWDSIAYPEKIPDDVPTAVFPNNKILGEALRQYLLFHTKTFDKFVNKQYVTALRLYRETPVRVPTLMLLSNTDPIGRVSNNQITIDCWEKMGMKVFLKIFEDSPHVGHLRKYRSEYKAQIDMYLNHLNLEENTRNQENIEYDRMKECSF